jgi:hypothetical protein
MTRRSSEKSLAEQLREQDAANNGRPPSDEPLGDLDPPPSPSAATQAKRNGQAACKHRLDVPRWLKARGVAFREKDTKDTRGRTVYVLDRCPLNPDHHDAAVIQADNGKLAAHCFDKSCAGKGWQDFKKAIGPPDGDHYDPPIVRKASDEEEGKDEGGSHASLLVRMAQATFELFYDGETTYGTVAGTAKTFPLNSRAFRQLISHLFFEAKCRAPSGETLRAALDTLAGKALFGGSSFPVRVRLAERDEAIFLDLGREDWAAVRITAAGWDLQSNYPVRFRHPRGMKSLPQPIRDGSVDALRQLVNIESEPDWRLRVGWLLAAFRPTGPYPVLILTGEQGSAKSTTARLLRSLIDPNAAPLRTGPRDGRDLVIAANNSWLLALDNLSSVPPWLSDCLCRLATGGGFTPRELYTDQDEVFFDSQRPVILTSIEDIADRGDLLDRAVIVRLPAIPEGKRRPEKEFWAVAEAARTAILGALLDVVAAGLRNLPNIHFDHLPRMADFALWVTACEQGLKWSPGSFLAAYAGNVADANELALDASPVWTPLRQLVETRGSWEGTVAQLLPELAQLAGLTADKKAPADWPKKPNTLTNCLRRLAPNMRRAGVAVDFRRTAGKRYIHLAANGRETSSPSSPSSLPPEKQGLISSASDDPVPVSDDPAARSDDPAAGENPGNHADVTMSDGHDDVSANLEAGGQTPEAPAPGTAAQGTPSHGKRRRGVL